MGSILKRKRLDGSIGYTAQLRIKRAGALVRRETQTFDREAAAKAWLKKRETELAAPGALYAPADPPLAKIIDRYLLETLKDFGKTKNQVLTTIKNSELGALRASQITSPALVDWLKNMTSQPQTRGNYLSHLAAVCTVARPAWGYPLDKAAVADARVVADKLGLIARSKERDRRPTLPELDRLLNYFKVYEAKRANAIPMTSLILFAIFSTRRQNEICRLLAQDLIEERSEILVRDMKNPGAALGNNVATALPPEALTLLLARGVKTGRLWPCNSESVSTSFARACKLLGVEDLHFHDLRHEGISRLFELGWNIPRVATVSGHRTWKSLQRYTHLEQIGDKYAGWAWLPQTQKIPLTREGQGDKTQEVPKKLG